MLKESIYKILEKGVKHPTNKEYVSDSSMLFESRRIALGVFGVAISAGILMKYPLKTILFLSLSTSIGTFLVFYGSLRFGKWVYHKVKSTESKKTVVILLVLLIILVFLLPFFMVHVLGYQ